MASRRAFLTRSTVTAGAAMLGSVAATAQGGPIPKDDGTVRDRLWIWTHPAGSHNYIKLADGSHPRSRMTPVEGALYLGLRNLYFVHYNGRPTFDEYEPYVRSFRSMKRVIWSLTGIISNTPCRPL